MSTFWFTDVGAEPKREFRGVFFLGDGNGHFSTPVTVKSFSKPGWGNFQTQQITKLTTTGEVIIQNFQLNDRKVKPITITFLDFQSPIDNEDGNISHAFMKYLAAAGKSPKQLEHLGGSDLNQHYVNAQVANFTMQELGPSGNPIGEWKIFGPILTSVDFGEINYANDAISTVKTSWTYSDFSYELK